MKRRVLLLSLAPAALAMTCQAALAVTELAIFEQGAFDAAQNDGKSILLHVAAPWCETCVAQREALKELEKVDAFKDYVVISIDFDTQKDVMRRFNANSRSTLIVYKGKVEKGRVVAVTNPEDIGTLLEKTL